MAPAEKCSPSLPTTRAAKLSAASLTPRRSISIVSPPMAFIFEWNSTQSTPSPEIDEAGAGVLPDDACSGAGRLDQCRTRLARRCRRLAEQIACLGRGAVTERGHDRIDADGAQRLERTELPAETPPHRAIDVVARSGDLAGDARGVEQCRRQRGAQELTDLVLAGEQRADAVAGVLDAPSRIDRPQSAAVPTAGTP